MINFGDSSVEENKQVFKSERIRVMNVIETMSENSKDGFNEIKGIKLRKNSLKFSLG